MGKFSRQQIDDIFLSFFFKKKKSPKETICINVKAYFLENESEKIFKMMSAEIFA